MRGRCLLPITGLSVLAAVGVQFSAATFVTADTTNPANAVSANADWVAPTAGASVVGKTTGGTTGFVRQGGTYYVYANASDAGNPATGIATVAGNLSTVSSSATSVALTAGTYTAGGTAYAYRSASLTARASLTAGSYAYSLALADVGGNSTTQSGFAVTVDNTVPSASDVQTVNVAGGTAGKPDLGDRVVLTFSEPIETESILAGWSGAA